MADEYINENTPRIVIKIKSIDDAKKVLNLLHRFDRKHNCCQIKMQVTAVNEVGLIATQQIKATYSDISKAINSLGISFYKP